MTASVHRLGSVKIAKGHGVYLSSAKSNVRFYIDRDLGDQYGYTAAKNPYRTKVTSKIKENDAGRRCLVLSIVPTTELTERGRGERANGVGTFCLEKGGQYRLDVPCTSFKKKNLFSKFRKAPCEAEILTNGDISVLLPDYFQFKPGPYKELAVEPKAVHVKNIKKITKKKTKKIESSMHDLDPNMHHTIYIGDYRILYAPGRDPEVIRPED